MVMASRVPRAISNPGRENVSENGTDVGAIVLVKVSMVSARRRGQDQQTGGSAGK